MQLQHLQRLSVIQKHFGSVARGVSTMAKLDINSKYKMPSGHEIPVLGYGVYQTLADVKFVH